MLFMAVAAAGPLSSSAQSRLQFGGYGEATFVHNLYSDDYKRYTDPSGYARGSHSRFDLPHVCFWMGYDFGKGWSMGTEVEFEHGGVGASTEIETEEAGEYESEIEQGGEVTLEQCWVQKQWAPWLKMRAGMQVVPVGLTNAQHEPDKMFGVFRPEGENSILPCTWHEVSLMLTGRLSHWEYQAMLLPGLDSDRFSAAGWINPGAGSPYEYKIGNALAGAFRLDYSGVKGLKIGLSGYMGNSFSNTLYATRSSKTAGITGTVSVLALDFTYKSKRFTARGSVDRGHLSDAAFISSFNKRMPKDSPSSHQTVASDAFCAGVEMGYDVWQGLWLFGRYDYYDSMLGMETQTWTHRSKITTGVNYIPVKQVILKAEYSLGLLSRAYTPEPAIAVGVCYSAKFL